ncbi:hypothetical protein [Bradyrhizobium sp. RDM4]|nr:hypothetical protein BST65_16900 [Bradyrhizobium canariense]
MNVLLARRIGMKSMTCFGICTAALLLTTAAYAAPDKSKETPGIAAYHATQGAFKRDRKITRHILRTERQKHAREDRHTTYSR